MCVCEVCVCVCVRCVCVCVCVCVCMCTCMCVLMPMKNMGRSTSTLTSACMRVYVFVCVMRVIRHALKMHSKCKQALKHTHPITLPTLASTLSPITMHNAHTNTCRRRSKVGLIQQYMAFGARMHNSNPFTHTHSHTHASRTSLIQHFLAFLGHDF